jgi:YHS domain-containing protein
MTMNRTVILGAVAALAAALAACDHDPGSHSHGPAPAAAKTIDPVCGMEVKEAKIKLARDGKEFAFCSDTCKGTFEKEPSRYAMGTCGCARTMPDCACGHCKALAAKAAPTEACGCGEEKAGGHTDHKH